MKMPDPAKMRVVRWVVIGAAVLLTAANLMALVGGSDSANTQGVLDRYTALIRADGPPSTQPADEGKKGKSKEKDPRIERIVKRHLFSPDPPEKKWKAAVSGVLGDTAYMDGSNAVQVGGDYKGAKLTAIGADWVTFEFQGTTHTLHVFGSGGSGPSPSGPSRPSGPSGPMIRPGPSAAPSPAQMRPSPRPSPRPSGGGKSVFANMPPEMLARVKEKFASLSPEEKEEKLEQLSEEDRELAAKW